MTKCCFNSVDENNYSRLSITIPPPSSRYVAVRCDSFTANCNIRVLNERDYLMMTVGGVPKNKIYFDDYTKLDAETFAELLNAKFEEASYGLMCSVDNCNRICFEGNSEFWFNDMTYNVKLLLGLYSVKDEEIRAEKIRSKPTSNANKHKLQILSVGMYLSTPILYLVSNIGDASFRNNSDDVINIQSCNTLLRINNSFSPNIPIIAGGDWTVAIVPSGYVSGCCLQLVDANMKPVDLLNPMYITLTLESIGGYEN